MRPVISTISSPCYKLARFLSRILRKSFKSAYALKNSLQFVRMIKKRNIPSEYKLISFDVENCFTNISTELALKIIERDFDQFVSKNTDIPKQQFMNLLKFCLVDCNYFSYEDKFIAMKSGLFMGSSLAPILVERVLDTIIDDTLMKLDFIPPFWCSYVDDHVTAIPENKIQVVLEALHSFDNNIKFTYEIEENGRLDYLDLSLYRKEGKVITNWFHKPIASNRMLNFYSNHPRSMKYNVAKSFIRKVFRMSHIDFWNENLQRIKCVLIKNNYPEKVINDLIQKVKRKKPIDASRSYAFLSRTRIGDESTLNNKTLTETNQFASLAYIPGLSEAISKSCKQFVPNVKLAMRPYMKNSSMFTNLKSRIKTDDKSGLVYKIDCAECNAVYIGETIQKFGTRKHQHSTDCQKPLNKFSSALVKHAKYKNHHFKFNDGKILKRENNKTKLQIHEVNNIIKFESVACNEKTDKKDYTNAYINLIKKQ